jgi:competence protein ComEA
MMIRRRYRKLESGGYLFLCLILLALAAKRHEAFFVTGTEEKTDENDLYYIQIRGKVPFRGTYVFAPRSDQDRLLCNPWQKKYHQDILNLTQPLPDTHALIEVIINDEERSVFRREIPAHQKLTLGIPISINRVTEEGLTAIPGIGPQTAKLLIQEREKRGGFKKLNELKSIKGIGPGTWHKIKPFLTL